jgi:RNA polymerase sigma factor (sigma-70 family)
MLAPSMATVDVATLYERHAPEIHDFLARTVRDPATAEDLTQNTFIRFLERGDTVREAEKVRPWLFTVAHNLAVTHVTRRRTADPIETAFAIASGEKGPEEAAITSAAATLVWDAARSLEPRQYAVLDLTVRRGFTVGEIAEVLEITPAHAAVVVHRAREALGQAIRLLVVVRQRKHCDRLAELVPEGTEVLTPDLRASVDRHMRRCEACKEVGARLTEPAELLGALPLLPLPLALHHLPLGLHAAAGAAATAHGGGSSLLSQVQGIGQRAAHLLSQPVVLAGLAALAVAGAGVGVAMQHGGGHPALSDVRGPRAGIGGGATVVVPPLTSGPGQAVGEVRQADAIQHGGEGARSEPAAPARTPIDNGPMLPPASAPPPPTSNPSPPPPTPLINVHQTVGPVSVDAVGAPPVPPSVTVTVAGQPIRVTGLHTRLF